MSGVLMVTDRQAEVHVSGHPGRPELEAMYRWIRPEILLPVHGERRHMAEQARLALASGIRHAPVQSNGDLLRLAPGAPEIIGKQDTGRLVLDGDVILPADGATINERRKLGLHGQISVAVAIDRKGKMIGKPTLRTQGVPVEEDKAAFLAEASNDAAAVIPKGSLEDDAVRERVRLAVRRTATRWTGKKPIVDVLLIRA
jgi:ribonuclease J